jgi:hypothetical protein
MCHLFNATGIIKFKRTKMGGNKRGKMKGQGLENFSLRIVKS